MYGSLDISTSGMIAQRTRMAVIASNLANVNSIENTNGEYAPYLRRAAMFAPVSDRDGGMGVKVSEIHIEQNSLRRVHKPESKHADEDGYVMAPDIDTTTEWVNGLQASRAYEANVIAAEATKSMLSQALRLIA